MNILLKALVVCLACVSTMVMAVDDPRGEFVRLDPTVPNEKLLVTPLACKTFVAQAVELTTLYLDGVSELDRLKALAVEVTLDIYDNDRYAGSAISVRFNSNIVTALADAAVKKDIGYGYTYPESVARQMPKLCADMVGTNTDHVKRIFEKKS